MPKELRHDCKTPSSKVVKGHFPGMDNCTIFTPEALKSTCFVCQRWYHAHLHAEPALGWDRDGDTLHLVLDISSTQPDLRHRGARCSPNPAWSHSCQAWQVSERATARPRRRWHPRRAAGRCAWVCLPSAGIL